MDALDHSDDRASAEALPAEKLQQALELMRMGIQWKLAALERQDPDATREQIDARLREWLFTDD